MLCAFAHAGCSFRPLPSEFRTQLKRSYTMEKIKLLYAELDKVIAGYKDVKIKLIHALLADGHVLLESVPGLAKTTLIAALQAAIANSKRQRIQMTMDLKPSDITGGR